MSNLHRDIAQQAQSMRLYVAGLGPRAASGFFAMRGQTMKGVPSTTKAGDRVKIALCCSECKQRNYDASKNRKNIPNRSELNKYCPFCRKHMVHNETKQWMLL